MFQIPKYLDTRVWTRTTDWSCRVATISNRSAIFCWSSCWEANCLGRYSFLTLKKTYSERRKRVPAKLTIVSEVKETWKFTKTKKNYLNLQEVRSGGERLLTMKRIAQMKERLDWSKEPCNAMAKWFAEARKLAFDQVRLVKCRVFVPKIEF